MIKFCYYQTVISKLLTSAQKGDGVTAGNNGGGGLSESTATS
jgi:hypothetical protein